MEGVRIHIRRTCPECQGTGTSSEPMSGHGHGGWRLCCIKCFGVGYVEEWIPIEQLLDLKLKIEFGNSQKPAA